MSNISDGLLKRWANVTDGEHIGITRQDIAAMSAKILDLRNRVNMERIVADGQAGQAMLSDCLWEARYNPDVASHTALWMKLTGQK